jgi:hypothetical protein
LNAKSQGVVMNSERKRSYVDQSMVGERSKSPRLVAWRLREAIKALCLVALLVGCGRDEGQAPPAEGATSVDAAVLTRLGPASAFETTAARPYAAQACARGEVDGLDVLVCHYADAAAAEKATPSLREFVAGALSGIVRKAGSDLVAIADRKEVDPKGERISKLVKAFTTP